VKQDAYSQEKRKKNRHKKKHQEEKRERIALLMCFEFLVNQLLKHSSFFLLTVNFNDHQNHASGRKENKGKELILPACLQYEGLSCQKTKPFNSLMLLMLDYHLFVFRQQSICIQYNLSFPGSYNYVINV